MSQAQTILPFREWRISPRWGTLLHIVNAWARWFDHDPMQWQIYALKDRILTVHGVPDGTDLQIITLCCNACQGRGHFGPPWNRDFCRKCVGSGVFARDYITLGRYRIGARLFHMPNGLSRFRVLDEDDETHWKPTGQGHVSVIYGRVPNSPVPHYHWRWFALIALTLRFDRENLPRVLSLMRYEARRRVGAWWNWGAGSAWRVRCQRAWSGLPVNWFGSNEDPSTPF